MNACECSVLVNSWGVSPTIAYHREYVSEYGCSRDSREGAWDWLCGCKGEPKLALRCDPLRPLQSEQV